jgi:hypothetical protein
MVWGTNMMLKALTLFVLSSLASAATCDRTCLLEQAKQFNANMLARTVEKIPLAAGANIRENTKAIALRDSKWMGVTKLLSDGLYADPILGNVIEHVAAETADGKTVYISGWSSSDGGQHWLDGRRNPVVGLRGAAGDGIPISLVEGF